MYVLTEAGQMTNTDIGFQIGHLEGAAGLAGLIKCMLMLEKGIILPNVHFEDPSKNIPFDRYGIRVPTEVIPWPTNLDRQASVNSFGYGGTNAHAILQAFPACSENAVLSNCAITASGCGVEIDERRLFVLSGQNDNALRDMRSQLLTYIQKKKAAGLTRDDFDSLSYTLGHRRSHLSCASYHIASNFSELEDELLASVMFNDRSTAGVRIGFIFTGQSAQWPRMAMELLRYRVFRQSIERAEMFLMDELNCDWSVTAELARPEAETRVRTSMVGQPICTIVQIAMVDLLRSWRIYPAAVTGHSSGEIAAAYCAGALTDRAAWEIAYHKGFVCEVLRQRSPKIQGSMISVGAGADVVRSYLDSYPPGQMDIACYNSPTSVTVSGDKSSIRDLLLRLMNDRVFAKELAVDSAYHSHHMSFVSEEYLRSIGHITPQHCDDPARIRMSSSVTGKTIDSSDLTAEYWVANLVSPVLFSDAFSEMMETPSKIPRHRRRNEPSIDFLVEVGPHGALRGPIQQILQSRSLKGVGYASMLHRKQDAVGSTMRVAGELYCRGLPVDMKAVNNFHQKPRVLVDLPAYPWNRSLAYWPTSRRIHNFLHRSQPRHSLLGVRTQDSDALHPAWRQFIDLDENPWIKDHVVHGSVLFPASGFVVAAIEAALQHSEAGREVANVRLEEFEIQKPLVIAEDGLRPEMITNFRPQRSPLRQGSSNWWEFSISCAWGEKEPQQHASGRVSIEYTLENSHLTSGFERIHQARKLDFLSFAPKVAGTMNQMEFYKASGDAGLMYGPEFTGVVEMSRGLGSCAWRVEMPDRQQTAPGRQESKYLIHPSTLDVMIHTLFGAINAGENFQNVPLPVAFDSLVVSASMLTEPKTQFSGLTVTKETTQRRTVADIHAASADWDKALIHMEGLRCTELPSRHNPSTSPESSPAPLGSVMWKPDIDLLDAMGLRSYIEDTQFGTAATERSLIAGFDVAAMVGRANPREIGSCTREEY
jgi:zearalenone synthase (highly reducing iterative type I polyketide synthase)